MMKATYLAQAKRLCTEIGLQTYGRKPHEMTPTSAEWKLRKAEALSREIRHLIEQAEKSDA